MNLTLTPPDRYGFPPNAYLDGKMIDGDEVLYDSEGREYYDLDDAAEYDRETGEGWLADGTHLHRVRVGDIGGALWPT